MSERADRAEPRPTAVDPARLVAPELAVGRIAFHGTPDAFATCAFVACIPARNEERRIGRCLEALDSELLPGDGVALLANGCRDATLAEALAATAGWTRPWLVAECEWREAGSAPLARRLAMDLAHGIAPEAVLFSLDADTVVLAGLRQAYKTEFERGFDLVCGRIGFIPEEAERLPPADPRNEATLRAYREISRHLAAQVRPDPDNPWPHHGNIGGANFAMRGEAYAAVGGLPTPAFGEDRALRRRAEAAGLRIRYADDPCVATSPRLDGRASGGLSDELRRNRFEADPIVDELLEPPATLLLRGRSRSAFLDEDDAATRQTLLLSLGVAQEEAARIAAQGGEAGWQQAEAASPRLRRTRLRLSDIRRLLPDLRMALAAVQGARSDSPPFR